jgi:hypothetical protein
MRGIKADASRRYQLIFMIILVDQKNIQNDTREKKPPRV